MTSPIRFFFFVITIACSTADSVAGGGVTGSGKPRKAITKKIGSKT